MITEVIFTLDMIQTNKIKRHIHTVIYGCNWHTKVKLKVFVENPCICMLLRIHAYVCMLYNIRQSCIFTHFCD